MFGPSSVEQWSDLWWDSATFPVQGHDTKAYPVQAPFSINLDLYNPTVDDDGTFSIFGIDDLEFPHSVSVVERSRTR